MGTEAGLARAGVTVAPGASAHLYGAACPPCPQICCAPHKVRAPAGREASAARGRRPRVFCCFLFRVVVQKVRDVTFAWAWFRLGMIAPRGRCRGCAGAAAQGGTESLVQRGGPAPGGAG